MCYALDGQTTDLRELLRVKLKSLTEEAKIIRAESHRLDRHQLGSVIQALLREHRVGIIRHESRHTHIAYGLIRGRKLEEIEAPNSTPFDIPSVNRMLKKYGKAGQELLAVKASGDAGRL